MKNASLTILGCGSALPTRKNFPPSQLLELREKQYLIDCGEGTQIRMRQMGLKTNRLGHIFISHLHGDHCFGIIGLISSFAMLNRTADLHIHAPADLEKILTPLLKYFCAEIPFEVIFHIIDTHMYEMIFEDRSVQVYSIPLNHRVPCAGFLFKEKPRDKNILRNQIDFYQIPVYRINEIKQGADYTTNEGEIIPNCELTSAPPPPKSFAYCSDTAFSNSIIPYIKGVDCLFHESTFLEEDKIRAESTKHSTARQAAEIAKLANVKKLILGHFSARYSSQDNFLQEAKSIFNNTVLAEDMRVYDI